MPVRGFIDMDIAVKPRKPRKAFSAPLIAETIYFHSKVPFLVVKNCARTTSNSCSNCSVQQMYLRVSITFQTGMCAFTRSTAGPISTLLPRQHQLVEQRRMVFQNICSNFHKSTKIGKHVHKGIPNSCGYGTS